MISTRRSWGLEGSGWEVASVALDEVGGEVTGRLECGALALAPGAGGKLHGHVARRWRHLDSCQCRTVVEADVPRVRYPDGPTAELEVVRADRFSRVAGLKEAHAIVVLQAATTRSRGRSTGG